MVLYVAVYNKFIAHIYLPLFLAPVVCLGQAHSSQKLYNFFFFLIVTKIIPSYCHHCYKIQLGVGALDFLGLGT